MLISVSLISFVLFISVDAFLDWNLDELEPPSNGTQFSLPKGALKVTPLLSAAPPDKNWRKARRAAAVRPFAGKVKSFSGFFTVNEEYESNMFFWFFLSEKRPRKAPVILWLHGGPGQSAMMGLFEESGPYKIVKGEATLRDTSWTKHYNVLYLDNPIGAGFSYTRSDDGYSQTIDEAVANLYEALRQFYKMFPEYAQNALYVVGQSYGAKYIPVLALKIDQQNKITNATKMNLKGMMLGCGCLDPVNQIAFGEYLYENGIVDHTSKQDIMGYEESAKSFLSSGFTILAAGPLALIGYKMMKAGYRVPLDSSDPHLDLSSYDDVEDFVTRDDVRKAIHVGDAEFHDKKMVLWYFKSDLLNSVRAQLSKTLGLGYKVLMYAGQFDMVIPHQQIDLVIDNLDWDKLVDFQKRAVQPWYSNNELAGYTKSYANLQQVFVRKANHMIVRSQPKWMLDLLCNFISK